VAVAATVRQLWAQTLRRVWNAPPAALALAATCAFGIGAITLSRALKTKTVTVSGTIVGWDKTIHNKNSYNWDVLIAVPGRGTLSADSEQLFRDTNPSGQGQSVNLRVRGSDIVQKVEYHGRWYQTEAASLTQDVIATYVLFTLGVLLTIALLSGLVRRRRAGATP
jgi:hypothetical protein